MLKKHVGKCSDKVKNIADRERVLQFAAAIGETNPLMIDEQYGKQSNFRGNIAPPTFPIVFNYGEIPELDLPDSGLLHGIQRFYYERPLLVDEEVNCSVEITNYYEKTSTNGILGFLVYKKSGEDMQGSLIFYEEQVIIITETVRKAMIV